MKSKVEGRNYKILQNETNYPEKINKKRTDTVLTQLYDNFQGIRELLEQLYYENYALYNFINESIFSYACMELDEGENWKINCVESRIKEIQDILMTHNDDIPEPEEVMTLQDYGFKNRVYDGFFWEKVLEDTDEQEVVEEIQDKENPIRRLRTIKWEKTDYGRSSVSIKYKKLPIGKKLMQAIRNTIANQESES